MISYLIFYKILQLFAVMLLGFALVKLRLVRSDDSVVLSKLCLYVLLPATVLSSFDIALTEDIRNGLLLSFAAAILIHLLLLLFDLLYRRLFRAGSVERASVMYSNAGVLIIPIVSYALGAEWVIYSCAFLSVQIVFLWTHGARLFERGEGIPFKKILLNPNILVIALGLVLLCCGIRLPAFVAEITFSLGNMIGNVGMLIAGMTIAKINPREMMRDKRLYVASAVRLLVIPLVLLGIIKLALLLLPVANAEKLLLISFLACITPSAATVMQFAQLHQQDEALAVAVNAFTALVGMLTMPLLVALYFL